MRTWAFARTFFPPVDQAGRPYEQHQYRQRKRSGSTANSSYVHLQLNRPGSSSKTPQANECDRGPETRADEAVVTAPTRREQPVALSHHPTQDLQEKQQTLWSGQFLCIRIVVMFARWCSAMWYELTRPLGIGSLKGKEPMRVRSRDYSRRDGFSRGGLEDEKTGAFLQSESSYVRARVSSLMKWVWAKQSRCSA